jgi:hypothetical protein
MSDNVDASRLMTPAADSNRIMVLLFEPGQCGTELGRWLGENGFIAWHANDVNHAIEELSDFTVRRRPDVVLLEVASLPQKFDTLRNAFCASSGDVEVCAFSERPPQPDREHFASDLDQLKSMIAGQVRPSNN